MAPVQDGTDRGGDVADAVGALTRSNPVELVECVVLRFDVGHPQGMCRHAGRWWVTTVDKGTHRGWLLGFDDDGVLHDRVELTDGVRYHPGGCDVRAGRLVTPVAEYRPRSTSVVVTVDLDGGSPDPLFFFDDHLGSATELDDGTLLAATWGSRELHRFGEDGTLVDSASNPSHHVDFQDTQWLAGDAVAATGVASLPAPGGELSVGGVALVDPITLGLTHEAPLHAWSPATGRSVGNNPTHLELVDGELLLRSVPDDGVGVAMLTHRFG